MENYLTHSGSLSATMKISSMPVSPSLALVHPTSLSLSSSLTAQPKPLVFSVKIMPSKTPLTHGLGKGGLASDRNKAYMEALLDVVEEIEQMEAEYSDLFRLQLALRSYEVGGLPSVPTLLRAWFAGPLHVRKSAGDPLCLPDVSTYGKHCQIFLEKMNDRCSR